MNQFSKQCSKCSEHKPQEYFPHRNTPKGRSFGITCKICTNKAKRENTDKYRAKNRRASLIYNFGITQAQYAELLESQGGCCAICELPQTSFEKNFAVDHNHVTGDIRGLLCSHCNRARVGRHSDGKLLRKIADYVESTTGLKVNGRAYGEAS